MRRISDLRCFRTTKQIVIAKDQKMISGLTLRNFKAFEFLAINLRPLTFILGPNNSGKSSIISPSRMLVQTMESYDQEVPLLLDGIMGDFGTYKDIVFGNHRGRVLEMSIDFE